MQCERLDDDGHDYILDIPHPQIESEDIKNVLSLAKESIEYYQNNLNC